MRLNCLDTVHSVDEFSEMGMRKMVTRCEAGAPLLPKECPRFKTYSTAGETSNRATRVDLRRAADLNADFESATQVRTQPPSLEAHRDTSLDKPKGASVYEKASFVERAAHVLSIPPSTSRWRDQLRILEERKAADDSLMIG